MKIRNRVINTLISFLFLGVLANPAIAEEEENQQMYLMSQNHFQLAHLSQYKKDVKEVLNILRESNFNHSYSASQLSGGRIYWFTPISNYAEIDMLDKSWDKVWENLSEEQQAKFKALGVGLISGKDVIIKYDGDLSYEPESDKEYTYFEGATYKFNHGSNDKVKEVAKQIKERYEANKATQPYRFFWHDIGGEFRSFTVVSYGENKVHIAQLEASDDKLFEKDKTMAKIWQEAVKHVNVTDSFTGKNLPDLFYGPTK